MSKRWLVAMAACGLVCGLVCAIAGGAVWYKAALGPNLTWEECAEDWRIHFEPGYKHDVVKKMDAERRRRTGADR